MSRRVAMAAGFLLLVTGFLLFRYLAEPADRASMVRNPADSQPIPEQVDDLPARGGTAAGRHEASGFEGFVQAGRTESTASDSIAEVPAMRTAPTGSSGQIEVTSAETRAEQPARDMPALEVLRHNSIGSGPEQIDLGGAGPEVDARDLPGAQSPMSSPASGSVGTTSQPGDESPTAGPSQVNLGFPGPGEEYRRTIESSESAAAAIEDNPEGSPLPAD